MGPLIYVNTVAKYPVSIFLRMSMDADVGFEWNRVLAMSLIAIVPSLIVFFTAQDSFVEGIAAGGVKDEKGRIIDSHAHLVQYIAGTGAGGELRSIGNGMAVYANGQTVRMIPKEFGGDQVTPEHLLQVMDKNGVEKAVLLQGNFYGYQNYYTHLAVKKYPDRFAGAGAYDPFSRDKDGIRRYLFEELGFKIEKFEVSTGSGLMAIHPELKLDGPVMDEACSYACDHGHVFVIDIGKCGSDSWQVPELCNLVKRYPEMKFVACHLLAPSNKDKDRLRWALKQLQLPNLWFDLSSVVHNCRPDESSISQGH